MKPMKLRALRKLLADLGCEEVRQDGTSHLIIRCGNCQTTVPIHGTEVPPGTLRAIRDHLAPCLGKGWLK